MYRYQEMADYFVYAQLRAQGEDSVEERQMILCIHSYLYMYLYVYIYLYI